MPVCFFLFLCVRACVCVSLSLSPLFLFLSQSLLPMLNQKLPVTKLSKFAKSESEESESFDSTAYATVVHENHRVGGKINVDEASRHSLHNFDVP